MTQIKAFIQKHYEVFAYLFFGGLTFVVNFVVFFLFTKQLNIGVYSSNLVAWFFSVLFAFFTNKYFVFMTKQTTFGEFFKEMLLFFWYRVVSLIMDMFLMYLFISLLNLNSMVAKVIVQVVVILLNYFFSKWFIFNKKESSH